MATKLRLVDMANGGQDCAFAVHEGLDFLDSVPGLIRKRYNDNWVWVGEGCEDQHWIAIYEKVPKRFRVVKEVKFSVPVWDPNPRIETLMGANAETLDELSNMVEDALFQLKNAREELAEYTRIKRKAEVRNAAREYEV